VREKRGRGAEGKLGRGTAHVGKRRERGVLGLGWLGPEREREEIARGRGRERVFGLVTGLLLSFLSFSSSLSLFYTQTIQTNLFEFK
jgi:hypothetical protein